MSNIKISELSESLSVTADDYLPIVKPAAVETYRASVYNISSAITTDYGISSIFTTQSLYATQSLYSTQSISSSYSIYSTQSLYSYFSTYATQSENSAYSISSSVVNYSIVSMFTSQSVYSTRSLNTTSSGYATQSLYSTNSLFNVSSSWATQSISSSTALTASYMNFGALPMTQTIFVATTNQTFLLSTIKASSLSRQMPVTISLIGGGGGSGGGMFSDNINQYWNYSGHNTAGGGQGGIAIYRLRPSEVYNLAGDLILNVGAGGTKGSYSAGANGGETYFTITGSKLYGVTAGGGRGALGESNWGDGGGAVGANVGEDKTQYCSGEHGHSGFYSFPSNDRNTLRYRTPIPIFYKKLLLTNFLGLTDEENNFLYTMGYEAIEQYPVAYGMGGMGKDGYSNSSDGNTGAIIIRYYSL